MSAQTGTTGSANLPTEPFRARFFARPRTRLGWWTVGLLAAFIVMSLINAAVFIPTAQNASDTGWRQVLLPFFGIFMLLCGMAAGILGMIAMIRGHERSWLVWIAVLPLLFTLFLLLGEFLGPPH